MIQVLCRFLSRPVAGSVEDGARLALMEVVRTWMSAFLPAPLTIVVFLFNSCS